MCDAAHLAKPGFFPWMTRLKLLYNVSRWHT